MTADLTAAEEDSADAAEAAVLSELDVILTLNEEHKTALKAFLGGQDVFAVIPAGFRKS